MGALDKMWENRPSNDGNCNYPTYVDPKNDSWQPPKEELPPPSADENKSSDK